MTDEQKKIAFEQARAQNPDREIEAVEFTVGSREYFFVVTSPNRGEWKRYKQEIAKAAGDIDALESAIERAAIAQIRYPERDQAAKCFDISPGIVQTFAAVLNRLAGVDSEAREKKF